MMPKVRRVAELVALGNSRAAVAAALQIKPTYVVWCLSRARAAGAELPRLPGHRGGGWWREGQGPQSKQSVA